VCQEEIQGEKGVGKIGKTRERAFCRNMGKVMSSAGEESHEYYSKIL